MNENNSFDSTFSKHELTQLTILELLEIIELKRFESHPNLIIQADEDLIKADNKANF